MSKVNHDKNKSHTHEKCLYRVSFVSEMNFYTRVSTLSSLSPMINVVKTKVVNENVRTRETYLNVLKDNV